MSTTSTNLTDLTSQIQGAVLLPGSPEYTQAQQGYHTPRSALAPAYIVQPAAHTDIPPALAFAAAHAPALEVAVKGGGVHSGTWASTAGGVLIDLARLRSVTLAPDRESVRVQGGARWGDVYDVGRKEGFEVVGAPLWDVGVGGSMVGGASGNLSGRYGLGTDNMLSATVVLADGRIVEASEEKEADLFWGIRGGGGQFGIVVEFVLRVLPPSGPQTAGSFVYPGSAHREVFKAVQEFHASATVDEKATLFFTRPAPDYEPTLIVAPWISAKSARATDDILRPFRTTAVPKTEKIITVPDQFTASHLSDATRALAPPRLTIRGVPLSQPWPEIMLGVWARWYKFTEENSDGRGSTVVWDVRNTGRIAEVDVGETAYVPREPHLPVAIQGRNTLPETDEAVSKFVASLANYMHSENTALLGRDLGIMVSIAQGDEPVEVVFGQNVGRLRKVKAKYDPERVWKRGVVVEPNSE
ncbi:FAD-binding domain-containing protein [Dentipellis sp. KUC8613]|nr:FAD-binding domain-containing protein [Dentipellis sp. KUC8613]